MDNPVPHGRGSRAGQRGLQGSRPRHNSAASSAHSPGAADDFLQGVFALSRDKKVRRWVRARGRD